MATPQKTMIGKRRDRVIATILSEKEYLLDEYLPPEVSSSFRKIVLDEINDLADFCMDLTADSGYVFNEDVGGLLREIRDAVV